MAVELQEEPGDGNAAARGVTATIMRWIRATLVACALLTALVPLASAQVSGEDAPAGAALRAALAAVVAALLATVLVIASRRWERSIAELGREQARFLDELPAVLVKGAIALSAAVSLLIELILIRWQATLFPLFSFYKNFGLLACFLGLGLGYALARRDEILLPLTAPLLLLQVVILVYLRHALPEPLQEAVWATPVVEQLNMGLPTASSAPSFVSIYLLLLSTFLLSALGLIPVGQLCGRLMARAEPLTAYGLNLLGSLLGVVVLFLISTLWAPPAVWFALALMVVLTFSSFRPAALLAGAGAALTTVTVLSLPVSIGVERIYSPYQLLERGAGKRGETMITAAGTYFQRVLDLSFQNAARDRDPELRAAAAYYELPYRIGVVPRRVLVVGAGTGNDVAAALRMGAKRVDAVEIDPAIAALGVQFHPERPYSDPRVRLFIDDARSFLRSTNETYDLVVYGLLDSHTLLSQASSVRLDSYVYTVEGLREGRARLAPGGAMSLSFSVLSPELGRKVRFMLEAAFDGVPPVCVGSSYDNAIVYLERQGPPLTIPREVLLNAGFNDVEPLVAGVAREVDLSTDDWPFFYMPRRAYPISYLVMAVVVLFPAFFLVRSAVGTRPRATEVVYFLLGAGFMLVETKAITELGLVFGNTWQVVAIAIAGVLTMAFAANWLVLRSGAKRPATWLVLVVGSLAFGFAAAQAGLIPAGAFGRVLAVTVLTCPLLFSGVAFSALLRSAGDLSAIMAANLFGAVCGGLLEYNSMYFGFRTLYVLAMVLYGAALVVVLVHRRSDPQPGPSRS